MMRRATDDPISGLRRRERRAWRRRERAIVASHHADLAAALAALRGAPVLAVTTGAAGTVIIRVPGWSVGLAGVGAPPRTAVAGVVGQPCHLTGARRYGRFWWLAVGITGKTAEPAIVVLGAAVRMHPAGGDQAPPALPGLAPHSRRKEYSLP
jgi:hypothetical protein